MGPGIICNRFQATRNVTGRQTGCPASGSGTPFRAASAQCVTLFEIEEVQVLGAEPDVDPVVDLGR